MAKLELWQFHYSHFCEKARWILDYKGLDRTDRALVPGFHIPIVRKATGQQRVPVLWVDGEAVPDSAEIARRLEVDHPEPSLIPEGELGVEALRWERHLGTELGPFVRQAWFFDLLQHRDYCISVFTSGADAAEARRFRRMYWLMKLAFKASMKVTKKRAVIAWKKTEAVMDEIAAATLETDYLVGDTFTIADLTAASLLSPLFPKHWRVFREPDPPPKSLTEVVDRYRDHAAMTWARDIWERHRTADN